MFEITVWSQRVFCTNRTTSFLDELNVSRRGCIVEWHTQHDAIIYLRLVCGDSGFALRVPVENGLVKQRRQTKQSTCLSNTIPIIAGRLRSGCRKAFPKVFSSGTSVRHDRRLHQ